MAFASDKSFLVLHAVRLKGMADTEAVSDLVGMPVDTAHQQATSLAEEKLLDHRETKVMSGWRLTPEGRQRHQSELDADVDNSGFIDLVGESYRVFLELNETFKIVCTDWQLRTEGGVQVPNDHTDRDHDDAVRDRLGAVHDRMVPVVDSLGASYQRFGRYGPRLVRSLERLDAGDHHAFTRPLYGSYHGVWMELHQDLLLTLRQERGEQDGT
jgi:hypothetical protein